MASVAIGQCLGVKRLDSRGERFNLMFCRCIRAPTGPVHPSHLCRRAELRDWVAMAIEAPSHLKRVSSRKKRHPVDAAMAGDAGNTFADVGRVIEVDVVRETGDSLPGYGLARGKAPSDRRQNLGVVPNLRVAGHADMRGGQAGATAGLDSGMAISAVKPEPSDVMLMTERDRLIAHPSGGKAWADTCIGAHDRKTENEQASHGQRAKTRIGRGREDLGHYAPSRLLSVANANRTTCKPVSRTRRGQYCSGSLSANPKNMQFE